MNLTNLTNFINFQLVTPEKTVLTSELTSLTCPTTLGEITILPHHIALVANLVPGELHAKSKTDEFFIHVSGGFVEVKPNSQVNVLADSAEHYHEINEQRALAAKKRAEEAMTKHPIGSPDHARVTAAFNRSLSRLNIVRKHSHAKNTPIEPGSFSQ